MLNLIKKRHCIIWSLQWAFCHFIGMGFVYKKRPSSKSHWTQCHFIMSTPIKGAWEELPELNRVPGWVTTIDHSKMISLHLKGKVSLLTNVIDIPPSGAAKTKKYWGKSKTIFRAQTIDSLSALRATIDWCGAQENFGPHGKISPRSIAGNGTSRAYLSRIIGETIAIL